jgi:2-oxoglutarate dehydrogenase E2 component (dihydrolipoamide succinyltransferase)
VAVNAPEAGTIKEFLANEEDTVTVGQDLVRLELGGAPEGGDKQQARSEPKEAASSEQSTSLDPEPSKKEESEPKEESSPPPPSAPQEMKSEPKKNSPPPEQAEPAKAGSKRNSPTLGNREERRVRIRS